MLPSDIEKEIKHLGLDTQSAQKMATTGNIEAWVHKFLLSGKGGHTNQEFSESLKREKRWWNGPIELNLADLSPAVGTEPNLEYVVDKADWHNWTSSLAKTFSQPIALPPLIVEYRSGELSIRDGNTRFGAMKLLGWPKCWVVIWYNSEADFQEHSQLLKQAV
ncbi:MAG: hypothetical protein AB8G95_05410 [Anaerolineae bacterium]